MTPRTLTDRSDPDCDERPARVRRARITVFDGGHEIVYEAGLRRLERQRRPE